MTARETHRSRDIRHYILSQIPSHPFDIPAITAKHFGITRQAASYHMNVLIKRKQVSAKGNTTKRSYSLVKKVLEKLNFQLKGLSEDTVWRKELKTYLRDAPKNIYELWEYGFTEMLNNAIDHSGGSTVKVEVFVSPISMSITIDDDGVGIFKKIKEAYHLEDERHAILELAKGKLTTDPENHTGEGIFFTSRCFDSFNIFSGSVCFNHDEHWIFEEDDTKKGTSIVMELHYDSTRVLRKIFDKFANEDEDYAFNRTVVPVDLLRHGKENLVSRSQAKRLMARVEKFKTVILDFQGVKTIGQAFADEIFRVFVNRHPETRIVPIHACIKVKRMMRRTRAAMKSTQ